MLLLLLALIVGGASAQYTWHSTVDVTPSATDAAIKDGPAPGFGVHTAYWKPSAAQCATSGGCGLFVFLPGSYGQPRFVRYVTNTAADLGFHAVGLAYDNSDALMNICAGAGDAQACQFDTRREAITGMDVSSYIAVSPANSIVNRLVKLLQYLDSQSPAMGWSRYLENSTSPDWSKITFAGHSQGAGTSQILGALYPVHRVVKFAGGVYLSAATYPPFRFTTSAQYFSFTHTDDSLFNGIQALDRLTLTLDTFGAVTSVDTASPPYGGTHMLSTSANSSNAHGAVASDTSLAFDANGAPIYDTAWKYLFGTPSHDVVATSGVSTGSSTTSGSSTTGVPSSRAPESTSTASFFSPALSSTCVLLFLGLFMM
jgi:hypothetical protein